MAQCESCGKTHHVGFVSTRLAGTDGVSLETAKWVDVFQQRKFECFFFAGESDYPLECSYIVPEAHFQYKEIKDIYKKTFGVRIRKRKTTQKIYEVKERLKGHLYKFIRRFHVDLLVIENAVTIPLNLPLGIALTELISETGLTAIAHHHDFFWERQHFMTNAVWDYLNMAFPPHLPSIQHVIINSSADNQLSLRTGISATVIPNVMDYEKPPAASDDYGADVRKSLGVAEDELLILQPTRVVKRKGIEHAIELVKRLNRKARLVVSHASGDEGHDYEKRLRQYSKLMGVQTRFVSKTINEHRGLTKDGRKIYTLEDIYPHADLVTYPSDIEGFGNAFLEAVYFKKPIVLNTYSIYELDIKPKGFDVIEINGYVTDKTVRRTRRVLDDPAYRAKMVSHNYETAKVHYSYAVLRRKLSALILDCMGCGALMENNDMT